MMRTPVRQLCSTPTWGTLPNEDEEDHNERMLLVRAEAEAAHQAAQRRGHPESPNGEYGHMPAPTREGLKDLSEWSLNRNVHAAFVKFCRCESNRKAAEAETMFATTPDITFGRYFAELGKG